MAPVCLLLWRHARLKPWLIATGQHGALFSDALDIFGVAPDEQLGVELADCTTPAQATARIAETLLPRLRALRPALLLSQGDTTSALAAAQAAQAAGIPVGHVEAGLRSHDLERPWPEEGNRIAIDRISDLLFAPGPDAIANISADPLISGRSHLTGNTGLDALRLIRERAQPHIPGGPRSLLVTLHRREVIGPPLGAICETLARIVRTHDVELRLPLHPNPALASALVV